MMKPNEENERVKRRYLSYLREAQGCSDATVEAAAAAIDRFAAFLGHRSFKTFHPERAAAFKRYLGSQTGARSGQLLSQSTLDSTLRALMLFTGWLAGEPRYKSRIKDTDAKYFSPSRADARAARAKRPRRVPTLEQIHRVIDAMPHGSAVERRDRALIALTALTGARDGALRTLRLRHLNLTERRLYQDPREVATKFAKQINTTFFPIGGRADEIVRGWAAYLSDVQGWQPDDPLFPSTRMAVGGRGGFEVAGIEPRFWSTTGPIRKIFREAFARVGLPYFHPHSFRHTLSALGGRVCRSPEQFKAWSQNLGHNGVLTTLMSYGEVTEDRQAEIIATVAQTGPDNGVDAVTTFLRSALEQRTKGNG